MDEGPVDLDASGVRQDQNLSAIFPSAAGDASGVHEQRNDDSLGAIRTRINRTEAEISEILDAIQDKLSLDYLKKQAEEKILDSVLKEVNDMMDKAGNAASEISSTVMEKAKEYPIPFALMGVGLSWLIARGFSGTGESETAPMSRARYNIDGEGVPESLYQSGLEEPGGSEYRQGGRFEKGGRMRHAAYRARETAGHMASEVKDKTKQLTGGSGYRTRKTKGGLWQAFEENPVLIGVAALAIGAGLGLMIPATRRERKIVGKAKEELSQKAHEFGEKTESSGFFRFSPQEGASHEEEKPRS